MTPKAAPVKSSGYAKLLAASLGTDYHVSSEVAFHPTRKWRFDFFVNSIVSLRGVAVEVEGGAFSPVAGRHGRGAGMRNDIEKYAEAMVLGYRVLRIMPEHLKNGMARDWIVRLLA